MTAAKKASASKVVELLIIVATAVALAIAIQAFVVKPYRIPSGSMLPTLHINQRVLVDRLANRFSSPKVGEIIVFHPPKNYADGCASQSQGDTQDGQSTQPCSVAQPRPSPDTFIKRVVGVGGDRLSIKNGHVIRNGVVEKDPYIVRCGSDGSCSFARAITVPHGDYYMMGDNRPDSEDSRFWGPVPRKWIIGEAFFTYWPPDRIGLL